MARRETLCFSCGQPSGGDALKNRLPDGRPCLACRERVLDEAPSLLPGAHRPQQLDLFEPVIPVAQDDGLPPDDGPIGA